MSSMLLSGAQGSLPLQFPPVGYLYANDYVNNQYKGLSDQNPANNNDDGRGFRQQITGVQPTFLQNRDGSLKKITVATALRLSTQGMVVEGQAVTCYSLW